MLSLYLKLKWKLVLLQLPIQRTMYKIMNCVFPANQAINQNAHVWGGVFLLFFLRNSKYARDQVKDYN